MEIFINRLKSTLLVRGNIKGVLALSWLSLMQHSTETDTDKVMKAFLEIRYGG